MTWARHSITAALLAGMQPKTAYTAAGLSRMIGTTRRAADQALRRMAATGPLGVRSIGGGRVYFTTQADADEFGAADAAELADQLRQRRAENLAANNNRLRAAGMHRNQVVKPRPSVPAPVHIPKPAPIDRPVDMSRAVWTIAKTPIGRFAVDPDSIERGAFVVDMPAGRWSDYAVRGAA